MGRHFRPADGDPRLKIFFLTQTLDRGGAERQLATLATAVRRQGRDVAIGVFYRGGALEPELAAGGVRVICLDKRGRWDILGFLARLHATLRRERPDILYSHLPAANLVAAAMGLLFRRMRVVWSIRASYMDLSRYDRLTALSYRLERMLARLPDRIVANSRAGKRRYAEQGFPADRMVVIPNGIDAEHFRRNQRDGQKRRTEWGVAADEPLIGLAARLEPMKDHDTFLRAAALAVAGNPKLRFVCIGEGAPEVGRELKALAGRLGIARAVIWAGVRDDMPAVYSALDVATSSSYGEGFPNVIGEAMACGVPCVVTDVGDSAFIVNGTGFVVPPRDPRALADAWCRMLELSEEARAELGAKARQRVRDGFSVEALCASMNQTFEDLLDREPSR